MKTEFNNNFPIYLQLVENLKIAIISGKIKPGERLLSVRDLAVQSKVNPNTVQKALAELEDMKLIFTERTNGKFVTTDEKLINDLKEDYADKLSRDYFKTMNDIGFNNEKAIKYLQKLEGENNGTTKM
ncbi:MAG: GntR family transcriptional regulator [Firmicutes bacterium]|nr:GntR family transcriptional regulator [Bacillota bacterium]